MAVNTELEQGKPKSICKAVENAVEMHLSYLEDEESTQGNDKICIRFDAGFHTNRA